MIRHCEPPEVVHGEAICTAVFKPKARFSLRCNPGYVPTPGKESTYCQVGGTWNKVIQCELPLLIISGGTVGQDNQGDSSVEAISLYPSTGCDINLPNMLLAEKSHRSLHNLIYLTDRRELLACYGLTGQKEATCDKLEAGIFIGQFFLEQSFISKRISLQHNGFILLPDRTRQTE